MNDPENSQLPVSSSTGFFIELTQQQKLVQEQESLLQRELLSALKKWDRPKAKYIFGAMEEWNKLDEFYTCTRNSLSQPNCVTYVLDVMLLRTLLDRLTPTRNEEISYVSGCDLGACKVLTHIWPLQLEQQSPAYALAMPMATADALIEMLEHGVPLLAMAHSHPGLGANATRPSGIDIAYFDRVKASGADVMGIIVARDGTVRFMKPGTPFNVLLQGKGIQQKEEHVYKISLR